MKHMLFDSVRTNIICLLVASAVLSVVIFIGFTYNNIMDHLNQTINNTYVVGLKSAGDQLKQAFEEMNLMAAKLTCRGGMNDQVKEMLTTDDTTQHNTLHSQMVRQLALDDYASSVVGRIAFYYPGEPDTVFLSNFFNYSFTAKTETRLYKKLPYAEYNLPRIMQGDYNIVLSMTRYAGKTDMGEYYLYLESDADYLSSLISQITEHAGPNVHVFLTDVQSTVVYCSSDFLQVGDQFSMQDAEKTNVCFSYETEDWLLYLSVPSAEYHQTTILVIREFVFVVILFIFVYILLALFIYRAAYGPLDAFIRELSECDVSGIYRRSAKNTREFHAYAIKIETMRERICELLTRVELESKQNAHLENQLLISRINPHFLHNTLNRISVNAADEGNAELGCTIQALNHLLYYNLGKNKASTLRDEIRAADDYVYLSQQILAFTYRKEIQIHESILEMHMPTFILQPLIENCIKHNSSKSDLEITLRIYQEEKTLHLQIMDNGRGIDTPQQMQLNEKIQAASMRDMGIGLGYVSSALMNFYSDRAVFRIEGNPTGGTIASITIKL